MFIGSFTSFRITSNFGGGLFNSFLLVLDNNLIFSATTYHISLLNVFGRTWLKFLLSQFKKINKSLIYLSDFSGLYLRDFKK